ncbi:MAG TPA: hypothetical protein VGV86_06720 [Acidimicrobiales bacterium]|nr:hypothetical protein [Acidimicrobiales bacterium]
MHETSPAATLVVSTFYGSHRVQATTRHDWGRGVLLGQRTGGGPGDFDDYAERHLGLAEGANDGIKAPVRLRLRRLPPPPPLRPHRLPLRAAEWRHKEIELAAHELLQYLDGPRS